MTKHNPITYRPGDGYRYVWGGGPYIGVYVAEDLSSAPVGAINVWDYETGQARIERTTEAVQGAVDTWRAAQ